MSKRKSSPNDEVIEKLRAANKTLRAQVRYLRKELKKYMNMEEVEYIQESEEIPIDTHKCVKCMHKQMIVIPAGIFTILLCPKCNSKRKVNADET